MIFLIEYIFITVASFSHFVQVVLAANELPSINDVTYPELIEIIAKVIEKTLEYW